MSKKPITAHIGAGMLLFSAICFLIGSFITLSDIGLRSLANSNLDAAIELTTLTIALGALVSIPMTYAREGHITARLISEFSPPVVGRFMRIQGALMSLLFMG
ncbi:MAG: TRAP transporter small permease subunit, partial [Oceanobacter sp.]